MLQSSLTYHKGIHPPHNATKNCSLRQSAKGKAPGTGELSGTYEMLQAAVFGSTAGLQKCCAFLNAMLAFEMPRVPELVNCKGVVRSIRGKNGPNAVRPIDIAEA